MNVQLIFLSGRATRDAEMITSKSKTNFAKFGLAVNEYNSKTKEEKATFYDVIVFGASADKVVELVKKGETVIVQGKPEVDVYLSKDGEAKGNITVVAESWRVLK